MYIAIVLATLAVIVVSSSTGGIWMSQRRRTRGAASAGPAVSTAPRNEDRAATLERIEAALTELFSSVTGSLSTMTGDSTKYGRALEQHRQSLERIATIEDLRELEQRLNEQVRDVQAANDRYRRELDAANLRVQEQQKDLERLQSSVGLDFLTELPNRQRLDEFMRDLMSRAERYGQRFAIVIFDLDHFKSINDQFGHAAGDRVLRALAQLLAEDKRASDFLARYGGEEFVMLLPQTTLENAVKLAEKLAERIRARNFQFQTQPIRLTVSAGVGEVAPGLDTADSLFERVDKALYRAKSEGRDRVCTSEAPAPRD